MIKDSAGGTFLSFVVNQDVTVYVGYDIHIDGTPSLLPDFTDTGDEKAASDKDFRLFAKDFSAATISLGSNDNGRGYSTYTVVINYLTGCTPYSVPCLPLEIPTTLALFHCRAQLNRCFMSSAVHQS